MPRALPRPGARGAALAACLALAPAAAAQTSEASWTRIEAHAELQNVFLLRSDADFDRTPPAYDASGQSVGALGTLLRPEVVWRPTDWLRLRYQAEIGLNVWSKHNPDEQDALAPDVFVMKHREVYAEGEPAEGWAFKAGYGRFTDPTGLFLYHWIGHAMAAHAFSQDASAMLFVGQIPDPVYEGILVGQNNFRRDEFVFGGSARIAFAGGGELQVALSNLVDGQEVGRTRWVIGPSMRLLGSLGPFEGFLDVAVQAGQFNGLVLGGGNQTTLAAALQAHGEAPVGPLRLALNVLALSPDDAYDGNALNHAFLYTGKSRSATVMLTEDEIRDWFDNQDERMSGWRGGFFLNRAGLLVADAKLTWPLSESVAPSLIVGGASALSPANALGQFLVGVETDLAVEIRLGEHVVVRLLGGALFPGSAGAALVNSFDRSQTNPIFMAEASLLVRG